jgi:hypothetical protein
LPWRNSRNDIICVIDYECMYDVIVFNSLSSNCRFIHSTDAE